MGGMMMAQRLEEEDDAMMGQHQEEHGKMMVQHQEEEDDAMMGHQLEVEVEVDGEIAGGEVVVTTVDSGAVTIVDEHSSSMRPSFH
jgi:hypothetical protein